MAWAHTSRPNLLPVSKKYSVTCEKAHAKSHNVRQKYHSGLGSAPSGSVSYHYDRVDPNALQNHDPRLHIGHGDHCLCFILVRSFRHSVQPYPSTGLWWLRFTIGLPSASELQKHILVLVYTRRSASLPPVLNVSLRPIPRFDQTTMVRTRRLPCRIALCLQATTATAQLPSLRGPYDVVTYFCQRWYHQCTVSLLHSL
jgi:hypothetical protein